MPYTAAAVHYHCGWIRTVVVDVVDVVDVDVEVEVEDVDEVDVVDVDVVVVVDCCGIWTNTGTHAVTFTSSTPYT